MEPRRTPTVTTRWCVPRVASARWTPGRKPGTTAPATSCTPGQCSRPQGRVGRRGSAPPVHPVPAQRHQGENRPGHAFRGQQRKRRRAPGRRPLGRHGLQGRGLHDRSNANIQQRPIRPLATQGAGTEAKAAIQSKIAGYRAALADVQPLTNRLTKFLVLAPESLSGWTAGPTVSAEAGQRVGAGVAPD
jgi:hypothetical protein